MKLGVRALSETFNNDLGVRGVFNADPKVSGGRGKKDKWKKENVTY